MSDDKPILPGEPLGQALDGYRTPALSPDFADRVVVAARDRAVPLPPIRQSGGGVRRWSSARRLVVGTVAAGALATAAAATGALDNLPIEIPTPKEVWATITGQDGSSERPPAISPSDEDTTSRGDESVEIEGAIDTGEELEEAFNRIDERRDERRSQRRDRVDSRIDEALERRRAQGLPAPTPEQEARLRERLEQGRERRDAIMDERRESNRDELRDRIEGGEELTPRELLREDRLNAAPPAMRERIEEFRELPPEERRDRIRQFRERRQEFRQQRLDETAAQRDPDAEQALQDRDSQGDVDDQSAILEQPE